MLMNDVEIGMKYSWNVQNFMGKNHPQIETKEVIAIQKQEDSDLVLVESLQTKNIFWTGVNVIQEDPKMLKELYQNFINSPSHSKYYIKNKYKNSDELSYILRIIKYPDNTLVEYMNIDGIVNQLHISWFENLKMEDYYHITSYIPKNFVQNQNAFSNSIVDSIDLVMKKLVLSK